MQLHASCVAFANQAVLIRGAAGSGKSSLALGLLAVGGALVADDRTDIKMVDDWPVASSPPAIRGLTEARGIGILSVDPAGPTRITVVVDMDQIETERLPEDRTTDIGGCQLPLLHNVESPCFVAAIRQYLIGGKAKV